MAGCDADKGKGGGTETGSVQQLPIQSSVVLLFVWCFGSERHDSDARAWSPRVPFGPDNCDINGWLARAPTATVNSLSHMLGEQPFTTDDYSRNHWLVAFLTLGEGWHNLHHAFQSSARHGITVREGQVAYLPDPTFWFIRMLEFLKLASKIRVPSETELLARSRNRNQSSVFKVKAQTFG